MPNVTTTKLYLFGGLAIAFGLIGGAALVWIIYHSKGSPELSSEHADKDSQDIETLPFYPILDDELLGNSLPIEESLVNESLLDEMHTEINLNIFNSSNQIASEFSGSTPFQTWLNDPNSVFGSIRHRHTEPLTVSPNVIPRQVNNTLPNRQVQSTNYFQSRQNSIVNDSSEFRNRNSTSYVHIYGSDDNATNYEASSVPIFSSFHLYNSTPASNFTTAIHSAASKIFLNLPISSTESVEARTKVLNYTSILNHRFSNHVTSTVATDVSFSKQNSLLMSLNTNTPAMATTALQKSTPIEVYKNNVDESSPASIATTTMQKALGLPFRALTYSKSFTSSPIETQPSMAEASLLKTEAKSVTFAKSSRYLDLTKFYFDQAKTKLSSTANQGIKTATPGLTTTELGLNQPTSASNLEMTTLKTFELLASTSYPVPRPSMLQGSLSSSSQRKRLIQTCARLERRFGICWMDGATGKFNRSCTKIASDIKGFLKCHICQHGYCRRCGGIFC